MCRLGAAGEPADRDALLPDYRREPDAKPRQPVTAPPAAAVEIRRLTYADLPQVVAIERRAFTTPWSLAMFVLELSKPSGVCLAAEAEGELVGYLVCSRYDTVWHVMNVAVDPDRRRRGIATRADRRAARAVGAGRAGHARGAPLQRAARSPSTSASASARPASGARYYADNGEDAVIMWRTAAARMILAIETSCDDTCAAVVTAAGEIRSNVVSSQGVHDRFGGVVPEIASRHHLELVNAVVDDALAARRRDARRRRRSSPSPRAPAWSARCSSASPPPRRWPPPAGCRSSPSTTSRATSPPTSSQPDPIEPPFVCLIASGGHTLLTRVTDHRGYELLGQTLDDAAGEAFDKGARLLGLGYPGGPALSKLAAQRRPGGVRLPDRRARRRAWTSRSPGSRPRCSTRSATWGRRRPRGAPPTSPRATSTRSSRR